MRCLEKKAADRWQSAEEILGHLEALATPSGGLTPTSTTPIPRSGGLPRGVGATAAVIVLALGAWLGFGRAGTPPAVAPLASLTQLTANPLETALTGAAISPDGSYFAYVDLGGLHVQIVETGERRTLDVGSTGTPWNVRWFPDGTRLLFLAANDGGANGRMVRFPLRRRAAACPPVSALGDGVPRRTQRCGGGWCQCERAVLRPSQGHGRETAKTPASWSVRTPGRASGMLNGHQTREAWPSAYGQGAAGERSTSWTSRVPDEPSCSRTAYFSSIGPRYCRSPGAPTAGSSSPVVTAAWERTRRIFGSWEPMFGRDRSWESRDVSLSLR